MEIVTQTTKTAPDPFSTPCARHDPSLFTDEDGTKYLLWQNTMIAPLSKDLSKYTAEPVRIDPAGTRPDPSGQPISRIGHEGATMIKVGEKYVHLGTGAEKGSGAELSRQARMESTHRWKS